MTNKAVACSDYGGLAYRIGNLDLNFIIKPKNQIKSMATLDLSQYGIKDVKKIIHNPSYDDLYKAELDPSLEGYEKGILTDLGAVDVFTGV